MTRLLHIAALLLAGCTEPDRSHAKATTGEGDRIAGQRIFVNCTAVLRDPVVRRAPYFIVVDCGEPDGGTR